MDMIKNAKKFMAGEGRESREWVRFFNGQYFFILSLMKKLFMTSWENLKDD